MNMLYMTEHLTQETDTSFLFRITQSIDTIIHLSYTQYTSDMFTVFYGIKN